MNIDINWDKAPEDATHACVDMAGGWTWMKVNLIGSVNHYWHNRFSEWRLRSPRTAEVAIPRPEEPAAPEWNGEGLPPVGCEFEFSYNGCSWEERVMLFNDGITCLMAHRKYPANRWHYKSDDPDVQCRPLRTKEQRDREEVVRGAAHIIEMKNGSPISLYIKYCENLYDAGMLRRAER